MNLKSFCFVALTSCLSILAAETEVIPHRQDKLPNQPYAPREALRHMTVPEGFSVELVASEPDIVNPIAMTFDDRGRIWITESIEYPRKPAGLGRDRVKILEDSNRDGVADKISVFSDNLNIPTGVAVGYGGVWVLNSPDLLFLREKDGKEVSREVIVTGFGRTDTHELPSSLTWGPDGWLYGLNGVFNESRVRSNNGKEYRFTCAMWRVHPRTHEFQVVCEGTSNPYGLAWDTEGSGIVEACHWANDHLFHFVETGHYQRQAGAYPPFTIKIGSITDHGHQKTAYCGIAFFDSDAYPEKFRERIYVGNIHGGCINVDRLQRDGATYLAQAEPDFLSANDAWFMPVSQKVGPDGCLYILDWYDRYHCAQDAGRDPEGIDRLKGRLYRVRYNNSPRTPAFDLSQETNEQLVQRLSSPNIYFRESAQRILTERLASSGSAELRTKLETLALDTGANRKARLHSVWTLIGSGSLSPVFHEKLLAHSDPAYRAWGSRAAGNFGKVSAPIQARISELARDGSPDVQLQVAIASRKIEGLDALSVLMDVLAHCGQDKLIPAIAWASLHPLLEKDGARFTALVQRVDLQSTPALALLLPRAVERMLSTQQPDTAAISTLIRWLIDREPLKAQEALALVSGKAREMTADNRMRLRDALHPLVNSLSSQPKDNPLYLSGQLLASQLELGSSDVESIRTQFASSESPERTRLLALEALIAFKDSSLLATLTPLLPSSSPVFLTRVFAALGKVDDPKLADVILANYAALPTETQLLAIDLLMQREPWARKLLNAVKDKKVPAGALNANHLRKILESNDREALWDVEKTFGRIREDRNPEREKVAAEMGDFFRSNPGDPHAGRQVFKNFCAQCHAIYGEGGAVGPDITANGRSSYDQLLSNVFDPSLVIGPAYQVTTVVTKDGRNLSGLITEDNDQRIALKLPGEGEEIIPRNNVKYTRVSKLSMMPEGIEQLLPRKDLADLFAFLSLDRPPDDPKAQTIPGTPSPKRNALRQERAIRVERQDKSLRIQARLPDGNEWFDLLTYVMEPSLRPYLHPVRDASGRIVLTDDRPDDHPWQHGIFTGFHRVNGFNYWKEDEGRQRFVRLGDIKEDTERISWTAFVELVDPRGDVVLEEEDEVTIYAPVSDNVYTIDFSFRLRAKNQDVNFGKFGVGGLAVRMPWDRAKPRQNHLNSNGLRGRDGEQKRAKWCLVERPFALQNETSTGGLQTGNGSKMPPEQIFGFAILDHPANSNHPSGWRVDEQGLINPAISMIDDWTLPSKTERPFHYRIVIYKGPAQAERIAKQFEVFASAAPGTAAPLHESVH